MENTKTLKPVFETKKHGLGGGFALLKQYWEQFDLSWQLLFIYICGLVSGVSSVNQISRLLSASPPLQFIVNLKTLTQCALSRFTSRKADWLKLSHGRLNALLTDKRMALTEGDVIAIEDTN